MKLSEGQKICVWGAALWVIAALLFPVVRGDAPLYAGESGRMLFWKVGQFEYIDRGLTAIQVAIGGVFLLAAALTVKNAQEEAADRRRIAGQVRRAAARSAESEQKKRA